MELNISAFLSTLPIMAKGMFGIFIVTGIIILCIKLLTHFAPKDKGKSE